MGELRASYGWESLYSEVRFQQTAEQNQQGKTGEKIMNPDIQKLSVVMHEKKLQSAATQRHWKKNSKSSPNIFVKIFSTLRKALTGGGWKQDQPQKATSVLQSAKR